MRILHYIIFYMRLSYLFRYNVHNVWKIFFYTSHLILFQAVSESDDAQGSNPALSLVVSGTGTLRHSHKKSRPAPPPPTGATTQQPATNGGGSSEPAPCYDEDLTIREPSELLVGVPSTLTTQWRHRPHSLVTGFVTYTASVSIISDVMNGQPSGFFSIFFQIF